MLLLDYFANNEACYAEAMFDKTFFKFALGFAAIVLASLAAIYVSGHIGTAPEDVQTASAR
jgi:hypothetical protein